MLPFLTSLRVSTCMTPIARTCKGRVCSCRKLLVLRLRVVPHFSSGIVQRAKRERAWKSPHARKGNTRRVALLAWVDFHVRSRFALSTIHEEKWGTTRSLIGTDHDDESQGVMIDYNLNFSYVRERSTWNTPRQSWILDSLFVELGFRIPC